MGAIRSRVPHRAPPGHSRHRAAAHVSRPREVCGLVATSYSSRWAHPMLSAVIVMSLIQLVMIVSLLVGAMIMMGLVCVRFAVSRALSASQDALPWRQRIRNSRPHHTSDRAAPEQGSAIVPLKPGNSPLRTWTAALRGRCSIAIALIREGATIDLLGAVMAALVTGMLDWLLAALGNDLRELPWRSRQRGAGWAARQVRRPEPTPSGCIGIGRAMAFSER